MTNHFLPNHRVTRRELSLIPAALRELMRARLQVSFGKADQYLPTSLSGNCAPFGIAEHREAENIATVVNGVANRTVWRSTCLVKALAAHRLLLRKKIPHSFHLGVQKSTQELKAHAWISVGQKIIIGGEEALLFNEISRVNVS